MNQRASLLGLVFLVVSGCASDDEVSNRYLPEHDVDFPDTLVAVVKANSGPDRGEPFVIVNRTHSQYLRWKEGEKVPIYQHPYFTKRPVSAWTVLTNEEMQALVEQELRPNGYFELAQPFSVDQMLEEGWPGREAIVVEHAGQAYVLYNPKEYDAAGKVVASLSPDKRPALELVRRLKLIVIAIIQANPSVERSIAPGEGGFGNPRELYSE